MPSTAFPVPKTSIVVMTAVVSILLCPATTVRASAPVYGYEVINVYPHDEAAFTQGLITQDNFFYEGTGRNGESSLRKVEVETGLVLKQYDVPDEYFAEGVTTLRDTIFQLTWRDSVAFTYVEGMDTFELIDTLPYEWDGWGLTHNGTHLIASDGSSTIRFLDPGTLSEVSQIQVNDDGDPVTLLNELEYVQGRIYSNVWFSDRIAVVDPASGLVESWLDLGGLRDSVSHDPEADVLNGIAYEPIGTRLFVTGKYWPKLFEIDVPTLQSSGVDDVVSLSAEGSLRSFPNPCSRQTHLTYRTQGEAPVSLRIFDIQGRLVRTLVDGRRGAGEHTVLLNVAGLPAGTYLARFMSGETAETKKVLVIQ